jgi:hypothetical protein
LGKSPRAAQDEMVKALGAMRAMELGQLARLLTRFVEVSGLDGGEPAPLMEESSGSVRRKLRKGK